MIMIKDIQFLKSYNKIWEKIEKSMKIDFNTKTTYGDGDDKYIKTKIKTYKDNRTTHSYNKKGSKKVSEEKYHINAYEKYHRQIFLEECKYEKENIKIKNHIDDELKSESDSDIDSDINNEE